MPGGFPRCPSRSMAASIPILMPSYPLTRRMIRWSGFRRCGRSFAGCGKPIPNREENMASDAIQIKKTIEELLRAPAEIGNKLPRALEEIGKYGIEKTLDENPDFLGRLMAQLRKADAARVFGHVSEATDKLSDLFWAGISFRAGQWQSMESLLTQ